MIRPNAWNHLISTVANLLVGFSQLPMANSHPEVIEMRWEHILFENKGQLSIRGSYALGNWVIHLTPLNVHLVCQVLWKPQTRPRLWNHITIYHGLFLQKQKQVNSELSQLWKSQRRHGNIPRDLKIHRCWLQGPHAARVAQVTTASCCPSLAQRLGWSNLSPNHWLMFWVQDRPFFIIVTIVLPFWWVWPFQFWPVSRKELDFTWLLDARTALFWWFFPRFSFPSEIRPRESKVLCFCHGGRRCTIHLPGLCTAMPRHRDHSALLLLLLLLLHRHRHRLHPLHLRDLRDADVVAHVADASRATCRCWWPTQKLARWLWHVMVQKPGTLKLSWWITWPPDLSAHLDHQIPLPAEPVEALPWPHRWPASGGVS